MRKGNKWRINSWRWTKIEEGVKETIEYEGDERGGGGEQTKIEGRGERERRK